MKKKPISKSVKKIIEREIGIATINLQEENENLKLTKGFLEEQVKHLKIDKEDLQFEIYKLKNPKSFIF